MLGTTFRRVAGELRRDVAAAHDRDPAARGVSSLQILAAWPGVQALLAHRLSHALAEHGWTGAARLLALVSRAVTNIEIHPRAQIGDGLFIDHGTGVVIGETAEIGKGVKIYQGVTLGALSFPKDAGGQLLRGIKRHPTLRDNVVVYAGATILGGETIVGEGAVIGGNTWVVESVPPGEKVLFTRTSRAKQRAILERAYGFGEGI